MAAKREDEYTQDAIDRTGVVEIRLPSVSEARHKYDSLTTSNKKKACEFDRWKEDKYVKKQREEAIIEKQFQHLSPESRRRSITQYQAVKNLEAQLNVERQYMKNAVGSITIEDPEQRPKTVIIPGVKPNVGPQVAILSKTLDLKTPEQLGLLDTESDQSDAEEETMPKDSDSDVDMY